MSLADFEIVIGLEVHAQLRTASKLFCACPHRFGAAPNQQVCERCLGLPGALPSLNRRAVELALRAALALACEIPATSGWARKSYFYPDLPKGYQITQWRHPLARGGSLDLGGAHPGRVIPLQRLHLEEDAGKSHHRGGRTAVDFNRAGAPLVEIVSEPALRSPAEAVTFLRLLRRRLRFLGVCDGNLQEGSLRCDANLSLRRPGETVLGRRTELKNLSSFRFLADALTFEAERHATLLGRDDPIFPETRLWDERAGETRALRRKEESHDYRYFPEPDLPPLRLPAGWLETLRETQPELPEAIEARFVGTLGLSPTDARTLCEEPEIATLFEAARARHPAPRALANWIVNELLAVTDRGRVAELRFGGAELGELVALIDGGVISGRTAKDVFRELVRAGGSPTDIVEKRGLAQITDRDVIAAAIDAVLADHPEVVARYRAGQTRVAGFLVGQVMKRTRGRARPELVNALLRERLGDEPEAE